MGTEAARSINQGGSWCVRITPPGASFPRPGRRSRPPVAPGARGSC
ncbi:hypothetical protein FTUN_2666 [Frigoriglobus tundricola]|uniref:Uncharacterized protein n=1 Tax=Frigoriglobus tundricola TaxID=2774151 RepID=A0A6M5YM59_9BACT|nr:hypothetical protein FTUN_2666 [Frigoriglobus tundricola]